MNTDLRWFKSSYSAEQGECVEVALAWTKSSYSANTGECVEVSASPRTIHVRDSKNTARPSLTLSPTTWATFIAPYRNKG